MKTLRNKKFSVLLSVLAIICLMTSALFFGTFSAKADAMPSITMEEGASARVAGDDVNGLRFIASISNQEYGWFSENVGADKTYASVKFGMLIAPAEYLDHADFNKANVFGIGENGESVTPVYAWATYTNGEWKYDEVANADKVRIINIVAGQMQNYKDNAGVNKMAIIGSIVDYQSYNIVREFVGRGYYQLLDSNGNIVETVFASHKDEVVDNNVRSMIEVVQTSIENEVLDEDQINSAKETYFDTIKDNVTVEKENVELLLGTTVAGHAYDGAKISENISTVVYTYEGIKTNFKLNSWIAPSKSGVSVEDGVVVAQSSSRNVITSEYLNLSVSVDVYTPISSRADMDALGFAYFADEKTDLWSYGKCYKLTNNIDYNVDVAEADKGYRMTDDNSDADIWDRYLIPIAAAMDGAKLLGASMSNGKLEWGIFGKIGKDGLRFSGIIDGAGFAIENAVIPYGTLFCYGNAGNCIVNNNFIGSMYGGGQLKNIAFTGLIFENPSHISGKANPYYTDGNNNNTGTQLQSNGYITGTTVIPNKDNSYTYGAASALNTSSNAGLVGMAQNSLIENVYVDAKINNGCWGNGQNGVVLALLQNDLDENQEIPTVADYKPYRNTYGGVINCITKTGYEFSNVSVSNKGNHLTHNNGMGAVVGRSLANAEQVKNCFAIGSLNVLDVNDTAAQPLTTIFCHNTNYMTADVTKSTNCGVYASASALQTAQADVLANMSIAKYLG